MAHCAPVPCSHCNACGPESVAIPILQPGYAGLHCNACGPLRIPIQIHSTVLPSPIRIAMLLHLRAFQFQSHPNHGAPILCSHCNAHAFCSIAIQHMPQVSADKNRGVTAWVARVWVRYPELVSARKLWNRTCGSRFSTGTRPHTGTSSFLWHLAH